MCSFPSERRRDPRAEEATRVVVCVCADRLRLSGLERGANVCVCVVIGGVGEDRKHTELYCCNSNRRDRGISIERGPGLTTVVATAKWPLRGSAS